MLRLLVLGALISHGSYGTAASSAHESAQGSPSKNPAVLLVLGDSISAAYGIDKSLGWVALLESRLDQQCPGIAVHNASVSGETSAGGLFRLPDLLARLNPAVVVIELGGNDGLRGLLPGQMQDNLQAMIDLVRQAGAEPLLLGIVIPPNYGEAYRRLYDKAIADVAESADVSFVSSFLEDVGGHAGLMQLDGIHPTVLGQPVLLNNAWQILSEPLRKLCPTLSLSAWENIP